MECWHSSEIECSNFTPVKRLRFEDRIGLEVSRFFRNSATFGGTTNRRWLPPFLDTTNGGRCSRKRRVPLNERWFEKALRVMSPIDLRSGFDIPEHVGLSLSIAITPFQRDGTGRRFGARSARFTNRSPNFAKGRLLCG